VTNEYYRVQVVAEAKEMLRKIGKKYRKKTYEVIRDLIRELEFEPDKRGQPLHAPLQGLYSLHYSRFRVIYRFEHGAAAVLGIAAGYHESGPRSYIYRAIERLVESGALEIKNPASE
jgi:mRNA-degrading endonuclease RelE of RelBE toxin-antitoxin system